VTRVIAPGGALGVLGSGQLGRMFAIAARRMGYRVHTFSPEADTPTGQAADVEVVAEYEDIEALLGVRRTDLRERLRAFRAEQAEKVRQALP